MNMKDIILTRKSVRTFDGRPLTDAHRQMLCDAISTITNPWGIPVKFALLDAKAHSLSSPVIRGEQLYIAGKVPKVKHCEEAFGYSFEKMVLYAWSLGIGTTWIGGTMKRELFERAAETGEDELMPIVSPLGYPATEKSEVDQKLRANVHGDERIAASELFFDKDFNTPLNDADTEFLEVVRWAPTAANMQPCRVVKDGNAWHFYEKHTMGQAANAPWDVQKIDIGIALCHFMSTCGGALVIADPGIAAPDDTEYISTVRI